MLSAFLGIEEEAVGADPQDRGLPARCRRRGESGKRSVGAAGAAGAARVASAARSGVAAFQAIESPRRTVSPPPPIVSVA